MSSSAFRVVLATLILGLAGMAARAQVSASRSFGPAIRVHASRVPASFSELVRPLAARHRRSETRMRALLSGERDLWLDRHARLVYHCAAEAPPAGGGDFNALAAPYPLEDTFRLHSRPGSTRKVFLDFDGHTTIGTWWNEDVNGAPIVSAPFSTDGSSAFSAAELEAVQQAWQRVAEDFAPFDLDVTTEDPGLEGLRRTSSADTAYGVRVVISPTDEWFGNSGGVAYLSVFSMINTGSDLPAFVFSGNLSNNEKNIGEASSHEAGHTLGLAHDGKSGTTYFSGVAGSDWAPIMGSGYYKNVTQWSRGEYSGASNTEDDFALMNQNGAAFYADDHGGTPASATLLTGTSPNAAGTIERQADRDYFRFETGAGNISFAVTPAPRGANLDLQIDLLDAGGALLVTANPAGLSATLSRMVAAGTYYIVVDGAGVGDPVTTGYSDYASVGRYSLAGSLVGGGSAAVTVTAPNGGEVWTAGGTELITWASTGLTGSVKLEYTVNGGATWLLINGSTANDGAEPWVVPNNPSTQARVRVGSLDGAAQDTSNSVFTLAAPSTSLTVVSPNGGETWRVNSSQSIAWSSTGLAGSVRLEYFNGVSWVSITPSTPNDGQESWITPGAANSNAVVRVTSVESPGVQDGSDAPFALVAPTLTVTSPNGGENWAGGSTQTVRWTTAHVAGAVRVDYSLDGGAVWSPVTTSTANDGAEPWVLPSGPATALVRVTALDGSAWDAGNGTFTIGSDSGDAYEVDDSAGAARVIASGETQARSIHLPGNEDWARFTLKSKTRVTLATAGETGGDTLLEVYRENGRLAVQNDNYVPGSGYSRIADKSLGGGTYYIRVTARNGALLSAYTLSLSTRRVTKKRQ